MQKREREKNTVNFAKQSVFKLISVQSVIFAVLAVVFIALFARFAVVGQLERLRTAESRLGDAEIELYAIQAANADYDEVTEQHGRFMKAAENGHALDCIGILEIPDEIIDSNVRLNGVSASGDKITIDVTLPSLDGINTIIDLLEAHDLVREVALSTAGAAVNGTATQGEDGDSEQSTEVRVTMAVTMENGDEVSG